MQDSAKGTKRGHTPLLLHDTGGMREMPNVGSTSPSQTGFLRYRIVAADVGVLHQALIGTGRRYLVPRRPTPLRSRASPDWSASWRASTGDQFNPPLSHWARDNCSRFGADWLIPILGLW